MTKAELEKFQTAISHSVKFPVFPILGSVLVVLKLLGQIDITWFWAIFPFWAPLAAVLGIVGVILLVALIIAGIVAVFK